MNDSLVYEIKSHLLDYLAGRNTLEEFEDWFVPETWDTEDSEAEPLAAEVDLRLAEHTSGHLPEDELRREFALLAADPSLNPVLSFSTVRETPPIRMSSGSSVKVSIAPALEEVGTRS